MGFWLPALLLGGVGASHHYASRELDYITKETEPTRTGGFWWGALFGLVGGTWVGMNFHGPIAKILRGVEWVLTLGGLRFGSNKPVPEQGAEIEKAKEAIEP